MAKREKVKSKLKAKSPPPPSDISSSDISDSSSDDESNDEEINMITKNLDRKTKLFITKLMEDLESVQAELESREETLIQQEDLYIASKKVLTLERSEVKSLRKALAKEQEDHAITKKANKFLKKSIVAWMKSIKNLRCNMTFFGIATHIFLRQRKPLLPPLVKVVENVLILI